MKTNLNPKILKLPGITKDHMKSYRQNGCFELAGVFYSNEDCVIQTKLTKNILILDCGSEEDLDAFCKDVFVEYLSAGSDVELNFIVHLSHPDVLASSQYIILLERIQQNNSQIEHVYIHPEFAMEERLRMEQRELFNDMDYNFSNLEFKSRFY